MKLIIGADIVPTDSNIKYFENGEIDELLDKDLQKVLLLQDYIILNLEVPLSDEKNPIVKCGPTLIASTKCIEGLRKINPFFYNLSNNHIMDQGEKGLFSTINLLKSNNISFAGAGSDLSEASKPYIVDILGVRVGIYCCVDIEYSIADVDKPGANPFDPLETYDSLQLLKTKCDYVIVLYHGGKEYYRYPTPFLQKICRKMIDKGADLVVCQHSHCVGSVENWGDGKIIYGQGNFLFDGGSDEYWDTAMLIQLEINGDKRDVSFIPIKKYKGKIGIADEDVIDNMQKRSANILDDGFVLENYKDFSKEYVISFIRAGLGKCGTNRFFGLLCKLTKGKIINHLYSSENILRMENSIMSDAHRELLICGLQEMKKVKLNNKKQHGG